jgi:hypothetical protein
MPSYKFVTSNGVTPHLDNFFCDTENIALSKWDNTYGHPIGLDRIINAKWIILITNSFENKNYLNSYIIWVKHGGGDPWMTDNN